MLITFFQIFAYIAVACSSLLILFRTYVSYALRLSSSSTTLIFGARVAIWDRNKIIVTIAMIAWLANVAFLIRGESPLRMYEKGHVLTPLKICFYTRYHDGERN
jgi:hypothetical protein